MKKRTCCFLSFLFPILIVTAGSSGAGEPVYSLTVKWTKSERNPVVSEVLNCALEQRSGVTVPIALSTLVSGPLWIGEFDFEIDRRLALVEISDPSVNEPTKNGTAPLEILQAEIAFEWGEEVTVFNSPAGTLSFVVSPSPENTEKDLDSGSTKGIPVIPEGEANQLEVKFRKPGNDDRVSAEIYNPTSYRLSELHVRVTAEKSGDFAGLDRVYKMSSSCEPLSAEVTQIDARLPQLPDGVDYQFKLEKVFGRKSR